jgi:hypothetical protein
MDWIYIVLLSLGAAGLLVLAYGWNLPSKWCVEERISLEESRESVFEYLSDLRNWEKWTIWNTEENPHFIFHYRGPETGPGAQQCWKNGKRYGSTKITASHAAERIEYLLVFKHANSHMDGVFELLPRGGTTEIVWKLKGDVGKNPLRRIMTRFFMVYMHRDCHRSLQQLKVKMEKV